MILRAYASHNFVRFLGNFPLGSINPFYILFKKKVDQKERRNEATWLKIFYL